jgi:photosystem II stability/assembly factor-like uncharacterized protein
MKATTGASLVPILVGLLVLLSFPSLAGANDGGANVVRGDECTISLFEVGGDEVTTTDTRSVETPRGNVSLVCRTELPDGLEPPRRAVRTRGELCQTPLGPTTDTDKIITPKGSVRLTCRVNGKPLPTSGWAIGSDVTGTPAIVHTADGGQTWEVQGDLTAWKGSPPNDISAVDDRTAWAALGSADEEPGGAILHTTDGGATWASQPIPAGLKGGIKSIKGLSRREAWAASLGGTVLHTTDGGATWNIVPHPTVPIYTVNRMDAIGNNVWIADCEGPDPMGAVVHTQDGGNAWRAEPLRFGDHNDKRDSALTVHAFSPEAVWASGSLLYAAPNPAFYRTLDGGLQWNLVISVGASNHLDDICAAGPDDVWGVMNTSGQGVIWRVHVAPDGKPAATNVSPKGLAHVTEGISCLDTRVAWVAALQEAPDPTKPLGIILHTTDGGKTWVQQAAPTHVGYWKISFAGARR